MGLIGQPVEPGRVDPTDSEQKAAREKQDAADRLARSQDPGAMGNIEVAGRNRGISDPADIPGTWQNQQREIAKFNQAQRDAISQDPGAMGRTDAKELFQARQAQSSQQQAPPQQESPPSPVRQISPTKLQTSPIPSPPKLQTPIPPPQPKPSGPPVPQLLSVPSRGFTRMEREWLQQLVEAVNTARAIAGKNVSVSENPGGGSVVNASDPQPA